ncbi:uncharacterized protein LOC131605180 [Vicia villosa]|uniref:uncharacterized protein LOC131605180 n=1 Tax=Vicia villosa TaxID=3911 RepID=UPI00273C4CDB|nr:uncharacterized protein LOC131605180 [Vicia villosa]
MIYSTVSAGFFVGNGYNIPFWHSFWKEEGILKLLYHVLFSVSELQDVSIAAVGGWRNGVWSWGNFGVSNEHLSVGPIATEMILLQQHISSVSPVCQGLDNVEWVQSLGGRFTVADCFRRINSFRVRSGPRDQFDAAMELVWRIEDPLKVKAFGWRCFINILSTKDHLTRKGILPSSNSSRVFCSAVGESALHSLLFCHAAVLVWRDMGERIGLTGLRGMSFKESFFVWFNFCKHNYVTKGKEGVVWLATCWTIWLVRNDIVFRKEKWNVSDMVWRAKALVWKWASIEKIVQSNCNFYEFSRNPMYYLS